MSDFVADFTSDGSVGLYSPDIGDIYHSKFGALSEAYEKFIFPSEFDKFITKNKNINILDICYGIGYNSKAFLNFYLNFLLQKNINIKSIDTNNIFGLKNYSVNIHAVEIDKNLIKISPFIKQIKNYNKSKKNNNNNLFCNLNLVSKNKFYISDDINLFLLLKIFDKYKYEFLDDDLKQILFNKANKKFFSQNFIGFIKKCDFSGYKLSYFECLSVLLHNIYYKYISNSYKKALKILKNGKINIEFYDEDIREFILSSSCLYDFIFLDAFSPSKMPSLWTVEFFAQLYNHLSDNGKILTYSNSASIRNAFLKNGFCVGKIFNKYENKFTGTIAAKNPELINYPLDDFDLGLINTKAGICYHDCDKLSFDNNKILEIRKNELETSDLCSSTKFIKEWKCHTM